MTRSWRLVNGLRFIILTAVLFVSFNSHSVNLDEEGKPLVYLRGSFGSEQWTPQEDYRFEREGDLYTLEINERNPLPAGCHFKIGDSDWDIVDLGAPRKDMWVDKTSDVTFTRRGENFNTNGIIKGKISFTWNQKEALIVSFIVEESIPGLDYYLSGTLPVLYINVYTDSSHSQLESEIISYNLSHKNYFEEAEYWLDLNGCKWMEDEGAKSIGSESDPLPLQIKGRGNWTFIGFSKKPFKIKLDKKQNLLGLSPYGSKHYVLLAHADDNKGYLRNFTGFKLGERIGLPWTPKQQPVEVVINGDYRGLYFLTESIRVEKGRIEISELDDNETDSSLISGGYLVELDNYDEENQIRLYEKSFVDSHFLDRLRITWDTPEIYSRIQERFITDQFNAINEAIGSNSDNTWSYLDMDDVARYYIVEEIISHVEAFHGSTYMFRDRGEGEKWHFSPLWDCGNAFNGNTDKFFYDCDPFGNTWIPSMRANTSFNQKVEDTWLWFMSEKFDGIFEDIDLYSSHIEEGAKSDRKRWVNEPHPDGGQNVADNSDMNNRKNEVKKHIKEKISWLKSRFGNYVGDNFPEPERDKTPAALLPDYAQDALVTLLPNSFDENVEDVEFYTLQGIRINNPEKGGIYIMRKGGKTIKIKL